MVYLDYELGSSTRIDTLRSKYNSFTLNSIGGNLNIAFSSVTFFYSFYYFYRKFESSKFKILGAFFISTQLAAMMFQLGVANYGMINELSSLSVGEENMNRIKELDLQAIRERRELQKERAIDSLGKL